MDSSSDFVVVANRLPVDRRVDRDGTVSWTPSPGGLVTALRPVLEEHSGAWIGWPGTTTAEDEEPVTTADLPHDNGVTLVPVALSPEDHEAFYEGFSNATLWPLYHDLIVHPLTRQGYPSIGCATCTLPVAEGEDPRSGRWAGTGKTECGLHT